MKEKMKSVISGVCLLTVLALMSCSSELGPQEYIGWVKDYENGLHMRKTQGNFIYDLQMQPTEYVALQQSGPSVTASELQETLNTLKNTQYYTLVVQLSDASKDFINANVDSQAEKQQKVYYYSYSFQDHISLREQNGKEWPCVLFHFEKTSDLQSSRTFVLGFENSTPMSNIATLIIRSPRLDAQGVELTVSKKNIPSLKI